MTTAGILVIEYGGIVTSYLCATADKYPGVSPMKLLMHTVQTWARARGNGFVQFGGGRGSDAGTLFRFKALFSKAHWPFYTGRWILDQRSYEYLAEWRRSQVESIGKELARSYFPIYRAPLPTAGPPEARRAPTVESPVEAIRGIGH